MIRHRIDRPSPAQVRLANGWSSTAERPAPWRSTRLVAFLLVLPLVIGLFGAPVGLPDAPERAVRCGLAMMEALEEFNRVRESAGAEAIQIGIGINTGPVIAGAIGSSRTLQYTVIGDAVNVASRLCNVAKAGEVLISESTMDLTRDRVQAETRESVQVKGKSKALTKETQEVIEDGGAEVAVGGVGEPAE